MKARPILFNSDMVRALLDGSKTQTRRQMKPQPPKDSTLHRYYGEEAPRQELAHKFGWFIPEAGDLWPCNDEDRIQCLYGKPGNLLIPSIYVAGLDERYCVDLNGDIWSRANGDWRKLKGAPTSNGYLAITPSINGKYPTKHIHRLVCESFYGAPLKEKNEVRHLDGNQLNNSPENLDWGSREDNLADRNFHGNALGDKHHASKLSASVIGKIKTSTLSQRKLAKEYGVSQSQIWCVKNNKTWRTDYKELPPNIPRWASRIILRITDIRVERVQDITAKDALAEGVIKRTGAVYPWGAYIVEDFSKLWESINKNWNDNPWVWCVSFEVIHKNVDEVIG